ncbi:MAG TPA: tRNA (guanosine(46)-N7)-methyltransferase TrmB [Caulobacteraceae bacterium]|nr:tRNA (guanosine(46)-N7)-methyltransferase TrmB [Caulobacteraceae bacterium]
MDHAPLRTYGRIKTRALKPRQAALVDGLLPGLGVPTGPFDPKALMAGGPEVWLEIGFGGGEHLAAQAERRPDVLMIGVEPFLNGVASALRHIDERGLKTVRIVQGDARDIVSRLPDASLDRVFILFPDPWPKTRHHKRRLVQSAFIAELARVAHPGAQLGFATDWRDYAAWTLERMAAQSDWAWTAEGPADWRNPPADHVTTRYEQKALGDTAPIFLNFVRL